MSGILNATALNCLSHPCSSRISHERGFLRQAQGDFQCQTPHLPPSTDCVGQLGSVANAFKKGAGIRAGARLFVTLTSPRPVAAIGTRSTGNPREADQPVPIFWAFKFTADRCAKMGDATARSEWKFARQNGRNRTAGPAGLAQPADQNRRIQSLQQATLSLEQSTQSSDGSQQAAAKKPVCEGHARRSWPGACPNQSAGSLGYRCLSGRNAAGFGRCNSSVHSPTGISMCALDELTAPFESVTACQIRG